MPYLLDETIAAVASPPGGAARGIVRLSGPDVVECVRRVVELERPVEVVDCPTVVAGSVVPEGMSSGLP